MNVSRQVVCLPMYPNLADADVQRVNDVIAYAATLQRKAAA
jgi:dTDP-4-amino-4,6-dideoxygalactose transaminase